MANISYLFRTTSAKPCDLCDLMEGEHDVPPYVPVHPHCECEVEILTTPDSENGDEEDKDTSFYEVRNVQVSPSEYTETIHYADFDDLPEDKTLQVTVTVGIEEEYLDDPLKAEDLPIDIPTGTESREVTLPAHTTGSVELEILMTDYVVTAELWKISTVTTERVALVKEEHVGDIGGLIKLRSGFEGLVVEESPSDGGGSGSDGFYQDGDEIPV